MYALDLTPVFNELLKKNDGRPTARVVFDPAKTDGFLKEAYRINGHIATLAQQLRQVRQAYLSTAPPRRLHRWRRRPPPHQRSGDDDAAASADDDAAAAPLTDAQRDEIDGNAKRLLRDLNASIRSLADAAALDQETQQALLRKRFAGPALRLPFVGMVTVKGVTGSGGGGGGSKDTAMTRSVEQADAEAALQQATLHRESILWYLRQRLQACGRVQQTMMEARLARMVGATTATAAAAAVATGPLQYPRPAPATTTAATTAAALEEEHQRAIGGGGGGGGGSSRPSAPSTRNEASDEAGLTAEQLQLFERGNQDMVKYYETTLDKVHAAEQSLVEIAELQTMLASNLELQATHVDQMVADAANTAENVARGNKELQKALARPSTARYTFYAASGLCLFVVVWDFFV